MEQIIRVSAVSFLNTLPFRYGLNQSEEISKHARIEYDIPSVCAQKLISGEVDVGLIPVAALKDIPDYHIISRYCIGARDKVDSVYLFGQVPVHKMESIYLDYRSRTSAGLIRILAEEYWHTSPEWKKASPGYEKQISGKTGGLIIGDKALELADDFTCRYDLANIWRKFTGEEFIFAAWVSRKKLSDEFLQAFNDALEYGIKHPDKAVEAMGNKYRHLPALDYLKNSIDYSMTDSKRKSLTLYLKKIKKLPPL
ncbi:MAG: menaquinone biosynthetic enzyme MqnA/MqnD family protein [Bacteroidota bacterium]